MPMWGGSKARPALVINTMEFTRAKLDEDRRKGRKRARGQIEPPKPEVAAPSDLHNSFIKAIRGSLRDMGEAYLEMINARQIKPAHIEALNRVASELQDLASSAEFRTLSRAAASMTRLTQQPAKSAAYPDLIKLHLDSMRSIANRAFKGEDNETSQQLLEALKLAVDSVTSE